MMGHSDKCNPITYWKGGTCVPCSLKPGHEVTPNCGRDDDGGRHEPPFKVCPADTFNDGSSARCRPCASCPRGFIKASACSTTSDTKCEDARTTSVPVTTIQTNQESTFKPDITLTPKLGLPDGGLLWAVPFVIVTSIMLVVISACLIYRKRKPGQRTMLTYRRSSYINAGFAPLPAPPGSNELEHILSPNILSAPLQTVLDNLDVLEELVILLDPESRGVKNTKHLASHCSFPATWITYTYSMKDSKSPLKAVLEGVTSRQPDWTVGHLTKLLIHMERNDAIAVLAKLGVNVMQV